MLKPKIIFSDFDGTLTRDEHLGPIFFDLLALLKKHNIPLVIVTGRSLSWGHFLLTHFPLKDVIVEGGGARVFKNGHLIEEELYVSEADINCLENFCQELKKDSPHLKLSVDSFGRKTDRAIELCDLQDGVFFHHIEELLTEKGINFSTSNVHLNFWCGEMSKYIAVTNYLQKVGVTSDEAIFFGDSLNDQTMFKSFKNSVGVANISKVMNQLVHKPTTILEGPENIGPNGVFNYLNNLLEK